MGRWSGLHPWRAILGWVAFVAICFVAGNAVGTTQIDDSQRGTGDSGRAARTIDDAGFNDRPGTEMVFVQTRTGAAQRQGARSRRHRRDGRARQAPGRRRSPRPGALRRRPLGHDRVRDPRRRRRRRVEGRADAGRHRHDRQGASRPARRPVRRRVDRQGARRSPRGRLPAGRVPLDPDHAGHPDRRVRRAAGGRHPGAARPDRRLLGDRPRGPHVDAHPDVGGRADPDDADRHGRRRRLLAVLPQAGAGGAGARRRQAGRARGRRGDQRPRRAHLGHHRRRVARRPVLHGRRRLGLDRRRLDPRRRRRRARLADGAAGRAGEAGRPRAPQPPAAAVADAPRAARLPRLGLGPRPRDAPPARRPPLRRRSCSRCWPSRRSACTPR